MSGTNLAVGVQHGDRSIPAHPLPGAPLIALALARSVFVSIETGFIDSAGEHVTLVDRLVTPAVQRMKQ